MQANKAISKPARNNALSIRHSVDTNTPSRIEQNGGAEAERLTEEAKKGKSRKRKGRKGKTWKLSEIGEQVEVDLSHPDATSQGKDTS